MGCEGGCRGGWASAAWGDCTSDTGVDTVDFGAVAVDAVDAVGVAIDAIRVTVRITVGEDTGGGGTVNTVDGFRCGLWRLV